jgi:hypothetical protein
MKRERRIYTPQKVTRHNAGGTLWAPVDQRGNEHGVTPSHSKKVMQAYCDLLNAQPVGESRNDSHVS